MSRATRLVTWSLCAAFAALLATQSLSRFQTYHNRTYDLAMYARQAWGLAHADAWDPILGAHFFGTHVSLVLWPLGLLGRVFGVVPVLLIAQALAVGFAALPLARIGARRFGDVGALCTASMWLAYPNISHVASYEFHPGTLAMLPLAIAWDGLDRRSPVRFIAGVLGVLACRADFALLTLLLGAVALWPRSPPAEFRRAGWAVVVLSVAYLALQFAVLRPMFWAVHTSFDEHFGRWGGSPFGIVRALFRTPQLVLAHFSEPKRLVYALRVLWPLGFLPLFALRLCLPALPFFAINLISAFPSTLEMYSHYLTPAVPTLIVAALAGLERISQRVRSPSDPRAHRASAYALVSLLLVSVASNLLGGAFPWSHGFQRSAFVSDAYSAQAARVVAAITPGASVQAPDPLLPHLVERKRVYRAPPPDRDADFVALDVSHRVRYGGREDLLRTTEEPEVRRWLMRRDYGLVHAETDLLLFSRGHEPREGPASRYLSGLPGAGYGVQLTRCLSVLSAWLDPQGLELELAAHAPCPADLALRIDIAGVHNRVDLLFDGLLSPALLREERVFSWHALSPIERRAIVQHGLALGALRASGEPPEYGDPVHQPIAVIH